MQVSSVSASNPYRPAPLYVAEALYLAACQAAALTAAAVQRRGQLNAQVAEQRGVGQIDCFL